MLFQAHELVDKGGDWRSRNKLKAYEAIYCLAVRDYSKAADLFIDCVSTFESYELVDFGKILCNNYICGIFYIYCILGSTQEGVELAEALSGSKL